MVKMYTPGMYTEAFLEYLSEAGVTGFDFWLTVQEEGTAIALALVEEEIRDNARL